MMESSRDVLKSLVTQVPVSLQAAPPSMDVPHRLRCDGGGGLRGLEEAVLPRPRPMAAMGGGGGGLRGLEEAVLPRPRPMAALGETGGRLETSIGGLEAYGAPESLLFEPERLSNDLSLVPSSTTKPRNRYMHPPSQLFLLRLHQWQKHPQQLPSPIQTKRIGKPKW